MRIKRLAQGDASLESQCVDSNAQFIFFYLTDRKDHYAILPIKLQAKRIRQATLLEQLDELDTELELQARRQGVRV